jgi:hypothetical protein
MKESASMSQYYGYKIVSLVDNSVLALERRLAEMERLYDKAAADLIEALDVASAYRATASTLHQEVERRNGAERRQTEGGDPTIGRRVASYAYPDRRKSWPR